jgi:probable phosphoglycerate mutase
MTLTKRDGTTIYFVHHGRTQIDEENRVHGWKETPETALTPRGERDAREAAGFLKTKGVGETYSSDLQRATQTADIIRGLLKIEKPNTERRGLRPLDVGIYAGMKADELDEVMSDLKSRLWARAPGGESVGKLIGRFGEELDRDIHEALEETHACAYVSHSHNLGLLPYLLSTGVAPIRLTAGVGPGGIIALHVSDEGGQVVIDHQWEPHPEKMDGT